MPEADRQVSIARRALRSEMRSSVLSFRQPSRSAGGWGGAGGAHIEGALGAGRMPVESSAAGLTTVAFHGSVPANAGPINHAQRTGSRLRHIQRAAGVLPDAISYL